MQEKQLYEYAIIRVVPLVEREEFLNVGIIVFCKKSNLICVRLSVNEKKLLHICKTIDLEQVKANLNSFEKIALGKNDGGPIASMDLPSRFRWLTAVRSTIIQTSRPHAGFCLNIENTANRLLEELVL